MSTKARAAPLLIGRLAVDTGVNIETIRYYERQGLLPHPPRTSGKHRIYDEHHIKRLAFIRRSRELGFTLKDVRKLLQLIDDDTPMCLASTKDIAVRHLEDVRGKIVSLRKLERALTSMTKACSPGEKLLCPILEALSAPN